MLNKLIYLCPLFLLGCASSNYTDYKQNINLPDPVIMASCVITTPTFKAGDNTSDLVRVIIDTSQELKQCSILNEKKKAYIKSILN